MTFNRITTAGISAGFGAVALAASSALAQTADGYAYHPHMWGGGYGGHFIFPIIGIIVVVLIVMAVMRMGCRHRHGYHCGHRRKSGSEALSILEERYAKGEIDKAEFEERRTTLQS